MAEADEDEDEQGERGWERGGLPFNHAQIAKGSKISQGCGFFLSGRFSISRWKTQPGKKPRKG